MHRNNTASNLFYKKLDIVLLPLKLAVIYLVHQNIVASELKDPICHSNECQIGSFSSEATICTTIDVV